MNVKLIPVALAALATFGLAGCSPTPAVVVETSDPTTSGSVVVVVPGDTETPETPASSTLGSTVKLGEWEVRVTRVIKNANREIRQANQFNSKAKGQYLLVEYTARYVGDERKADAEGDLGWSFTDSSGTVLDPSAVVTPADDTDQPSEARKGGSVKLDVAFDVAPTKISGGILSVEEYFGSTYADFDL